MTWSEIHYELYRGHPDAEKINHIEGILAQKFRQSPSPGEKTKWARLLSKIDAERPRPLGRWAFWLLHSEESLRSNLGVEELCSELNILAKARFLSQDFANSQLSYDEIVASKNCSADLKDFARFQSGWILFNQKKEKSALQKWMSLREDFKKRGSLYSYALFKESTQLKLQGEFNGPTLSNLIDDCGGFAQLCEATLQGALEAIRKSAQDNASIDQKMHLLAKHYSRDSLGSAYLSSRLFHFSSACSRLQWLPSDVDPLSLREQIDSCLELIDGSESSQRLLLLVALKGHIGQYPLCATCVMNIARASQSYEGDLQACRFLMEQSVEVLSFANLERFCLQTAATQSLQDAFAELIHRNAWDMYFSEKEMIQLARHFGYTQKDEDHFAKTLDLLLEVLLDPRLDKEDFEMEREVVVQEVQGFEDSPDDF